MSSPPNASKLPPKQAGKFKPKRKKKKKLSPEEQAANDAKEAEIAEAEAREEEEERRMTVEKQREGGRRERRGGRVKQEAPRGKTVMMAMNPKEQKAAIKRQEGSSRASPRSRLSKAGGGGGKGKGGDGSDDEILGEIAAEDLKPKPKPDEELWDSESSDSDSDFSENVKTKKKKKKAEPKGKNKTKVEQTYESEDSDVDVSVGRTRMNERSMEPRRLPLHGNYKSLEDSEDEEDEELVPPFLPQDASEEELQKEKGELFLFQLPTRLPKLKSAGSGSNGVGKGAESDMAQLFGTTSGGEGGSAGGNKVKDEDEQEEKKGFFDETLSKMGGKLGRIDVYENGEAELVITGSDGEEIRLDVSTGIKCGFKRTATIVDVEKKKFGDLGDISKTIVVTPQILDE